MLTVNPKKIVPLVILTNRIISVFLAFSLVVLMISQNWQTNLPTGVQLLLNFSCVNELNTVCKYKYIYL